MDNSATDIAAEQEHLDQLLARVDHARGVLESRFKDVRKEADIDDPQGLMMRDREARDIALRLESYSAAEVGLMFGRIDVHDPEAENPVPGHPDVDRRYIGRIGLHYSDDTMRTLLMDWRAPMARPFYLATTMHPDGVTTRRHIKTRGRTIVGVSDETLSAPTGQAESSDSAESRSGMVEGDARGGVGKETALLEAVTRARTPQMRDIVETIAAEQDQIIRSEHRGVTVVQGGPGTGKTAVALHRAAYLLYTWREQLKNTGVLIVGPNDRFLTYISQVLPSLGETGVVLATPGTLLPGIQTTPETDLLAREVKGSTEMLTILANAVKTWQTVPDAERRLRIDGVEITLTPAMVRAARTRARRSRKPHNLARPVFAEHLTGSLTGALADAIGADPLDEAGGGNLLSRADRAQLHQDLAQEPVVEELVEEFWPEVTPEQVLRRLYEEPEAAASDYDDATLDGLRRGGSAEWEWTDADAPLLDELTDLVGFIDDEEAAHAEREQWLEKIAEAQEALDILSGSASQDLDDGFAPEILMAYDVLDAETLAKRQRTTDNRSTAQRAAADTRWAFGHVIVDEAQELSPMAWRMIFRRSPNRWMTVVGDPAQTGNPAGVEAWSDTLEPFVADRWKLHELTVNYRTPQDIADVAAQLLPEIAPEQREPVALRATGTGVRYAPMSELEREVHGAMDRAGEGLVGVISADPGNMSARLGLGDERVIVADTSRAKGLEFDEVVVVEPADIVGASPQGLNDVYVAITRATQGLTVVHDEPLPWD
ncbi:AAA family ATPase [Corynebacterium falsenii]|uniref:AAA family ATPase n=1 Tax=Corynebacterium falsenii TaxID=108486 RepID=UPI001CCFDFD6|nr:AAA family ATPase [Corynebacterium falsenii]UBI06280.1 AAA family ATPase [Corynebacterium falsenii]